MVKIFRSDVFRKNRIRQSIVINLQPVCIKVTFISNCFKNFGFEDILTYLPYYTSLEMVFFESFLSAKNCIASLLNVKITKRLNWNN